MVQSSLSGGGLSLCGSFSARLAGVRIARRAARLMCAARSLHAHLDRRGDCACWVPLLVAPQGRAASLAGGHRVHWMLRRLPCVGEQTVRFPLLGAPRVRSGRRAVQAEHVTVSSVFEHVWQSAMPPLSVLLQG